MMSKDPFETDLDALMRDYGAPIADFGFSDAVVAKVEKQSLLKRGLILGACFAGGLVMASQVKGAKLFAFDINAAPDTGVDLTAPFRDVAGTLLSTQSGTMALAMAALMLTGLAVWLAKDAMEGQI